MSSTGVTTNELTPPATAPQTMTRPMPGRWMLAFVDEVLDALDGDGDGVDGDGDGEADCDGDADGLDGDDNGFDGRGLRELRRV